MPETDASDWVVMARRTPTSGVTADRWHDCRRHPAPWTDDHSTS